MNDRFDIIISGASATGLALALALSRSTDGAIRLAVVDKAHKGAQLAQSPRAFAISAASRNLLDSVGAWATIAPYAQAVTTIEITDSPLQAGVRPILLTYDNVTDDGDPASFIVPDRVIADALRDAAQAASGVQLVHGFDVEGFEAGTAGATLTAKDKRQLDADLVVAAEGRLGRLRDLAGIKSIGWDYHQNGICTVVAHEKPHHGRAMQHFLPSGPFAILPLPGNRSCITWTEKRTEAERIMALSADDFLAEVDQRFGGRLGALTIEQPPASWPLSYRLARSFIADRLALVGDSARGVHPIAGQGLNLGFRDVAALAETIVETMRLGLPPSDSDALERYQSWRRFDSVTSSAAYDGLNRIFANNNTLLRSLREASLGLVDRLPFAKSLLVREAAGLTGDVPRLLKGEAI